VSALPASTTLPADNGDPRTTSEVIISLLPVRPTSVTSIPSEFWYLLAPTPLPHGATPTNDLLGEASSPVAPTSLTYGPVPCSDLRGGCPPVAPTSLTYGAVPSSDLRNEARATTAVYTIDCIHHFCPSGQPTVITMLPFLPKITVKPSGPEPITTQTTMESVVKKDPVKTSYPDVPPKPTQTQPIVLTVSIPSMRPLPQSVATTDPCYRHYCPPCHTTSSQLPGPIFSAK
jgi:hypothetical protein